MRTKISLLGLMLLSVVACNRTASTQTGEKVPALPDASWEVSEWISAADASVKDPAEDNDRAADGDAIIIGGADDQNTAINAALTAAFELV